MKDEIDKGFKLLWSFVPTNHIYRYLNNDLFDIWCSEQLEDESLIAQSYIFKVYNWPFDNGVILQLMERSHKFMNNYNPELKIEADSCPICMDKLEKNNLAIIQCGHQLCLKCFTAMIIKKNDSNRTNNNHTCPLCRGEI